MNKDTITMYARAISELVVSILSVLAVSHSNIPVISENTLTIVVTGIIIIGVNFWNHYKNNDYTTEAKAATKLMKEMKANKDAVGGEVAGDSDTEHEVNDPEDVETKKASTKKAVK